MDYSRSSSACAGGDDHHKHTVLETVSDRQTGVSARHHEHRSAEAEGKREKPTLIAFTQREKLHRGKSDTEGKAFVALLSVAFFLSYR